MPRQRWVRVAVVAAVLGGCGTVQTQALKAASSSSGAVRTVMPSDWIVDHTFRRTAPAGEGLRASSDGSRRMIVYASITALRDALGDNPNSAVYNFRHVQTLLGGLDGFRLGDGCVLDAIRPLEGAGFFGQARVMRRCSGPWDREVRATLVDANRTTVLWVTVASDADDALDLAQRAVENVVVDREAVPSRVASDAVTGP
jgi:hypothetical protein